MSERKLVTVREIVALDPIEGADLIEVATVGAWKLVVKKGEFKVGDLCVYFEIDSFLPESDPRYAFLMKAGVREFEGARGHKLRTIKLRGQLSQGLALPTSLFPEILAAFDAVGTVSISTSIFEMDFTELLGIKKYEAPMSAELAGQAEGYFPSFIRKTDQERCQNLKAEIFGYEEVLKEVEFDADKIPPEAIAAGRLKIIDGKVYSVHPAKAVRGARYEVTVKLDGTSGTFFHYNGTVGVCSRNLQLKVNEDNKDNTFIKILRELGLDRDLPNLGNIAIQGEVMGEGIQKNREQLKGHALFVFDMQNLDTGEYLTATERAEVMTKLSNKVFHVPVLHADVSLEELGLATVDDLLKFAEGPSLKNPIREGVVFKRLDGKFSFKAISNLFLMKEKD